MLARTTAFALMGAASLTACAQEGRVTEKGTQRPLEGVVVVKAWRGTVIGVVQNSQKCYHVAHARSDREGRFSLPRFSWQLNDIADRRAFIEAAYLPGYHVVETNFEDRIVMERHSDSPDVRRAQVLEAVAKMPLDCPREEVRRLVDPILRPTYAELEPMVETQSQFEKAEDILGMIDVFTLGDDAAHANSLRRRAEWRENPRPRRKAEMPQQGGTR